MRPHFHIKLTPAEKQAVEDFIQKMARAINHRARGRGWAILVSAQGWTIREICNHHRVSPRTVRDWFHRFQKYGLSSLYYRPRPRSLTVEQENRLLEFSQRAKLLQLKARTKIRALRQVMPTYRQCTEWVRQNYGISLSPERVRQIVRSAAVRP